MDGNSEICLGLGLGLTESYPKREITPKKNKRVVFLDLSIPSHPYDHQLNSSSKTIREDHEKQHGSMNSFSNGTKDDDDINFSMNFCRKKLRLTRDQTTLLEDSFKQHTTLNTAQKQTLAEKLNLKPRQVEVWFQNRRARTKLKQTEVECEFLKKNCEKLSDENRRLKKELLELRSSQKVDKPAAAVATPLFHRIPKEEKNGTGRGGGEGAAAAVIEVVQEP
ncbi:hypothetical protein ACS0TY_024590 [Phlomoides rotata]